MSGPRAAAEEREVKLAVADDFRLPDLSSLDGVSASDRGDESLRAVYWDTADLRLACAGVGLRSRNGTWTFKGTSRREGDAVVRDEVEARGDDGVVPSAVLAHAQRYADPAALHPVAELDSIRHTIDLACGDQRAEVVHDRVTVLDGAREVAHFAEVEVEFEPHSTALVDSVVGLMCRHGGIVDGTPKLVRALRALGYDPPPMEE